MAGETYKVFVSAVSNELGAARRAVTADLRARGLSVREQDDFTQHPDTTLRKLHDYIHGCDAVVCIIGRTAGATPPADEPFRHMLPAGFAAASYTQWELFFARHFHRRLLRFVAKDEFYPAGQPPHWDATQKQLVDDLTDVRGDDRFHFPSQDSLRAEVLRQPWPDLRSGKPIDLRYPSLGTLFKGRDALLRRLRGSLESGHRQAAITGHAVHGLGGVGKTRAAIEYAWASLGDYAALLFVEAETPAKLHTNIAGLAGLLLPGETAQQEDVRFEAVLGWFNAHPGFLLILDNIDDPAALTAAERLIARVQGGHVLLTGRLTALPAGVKTFSLDLLKPDDATEFLLERTEGTRLPAADDAAEAHALAAELDGFALALEHAGAFIARRRLGLAAYRALWRESGETVLAWSAPAITHYPRAIALTWSTSVAWLSPAARVLLERLAFLAPDPVPEFLLDEPVPDAESADWPEALADLADYSLATRLTMEFRHGEQPSFAVHRLVQEVTRRSLDEPGRRQRLTEALAWVNAAFTGHPQDVRSWKRLDPLAPHAAALAWAADQEGIAAPTARLMGALDVLLRARARTIESEGKNRDAGKYATNESGNWRDVEAGASILTA